MIRCQDSLKSDSWPHLAGVEYDSWEDYNATWSNDDEEDQLSLLTNLTRMRMSLGRFGILGVLLFEYLGFGAGGFLHYVGLPLLMG